MTWSPKASGRAEGVVARSSLTVLIMTYSTV